MTQTSPDPGRETRLVEVKGRQIVIRQLTEMQMLLLAREARKVSNPNGDGTTRMNSAARIMDILESAVVQPEDVEYLIDLNLQGDLTIGDMMGFVTAFTEEAKPVKVARGRPRKRV
jgi:hypothetical protein